MIYWQLQSKNYCLNIYQHPTVRESDAISSPLTMPLLVQKIPLSWIPLWMLLFCLVTISVDKKVDAFQCYVCDSKDDVECTEKLPDTTRLIAKDCKNITGARYCIKTTNIYAGEFGTKRFCAANDHGNYCKYIKQLNGEREYRSCVLTCDTENCNGTVSALKQTNTFYVVFFMICISLTMLANNYYNNEL